MASEPVKYNFDRFQIDLATRQLFKEGVAVPLPAKVFDTLVVLLRNHPRTVSREELLQTVWGGAAVSDDSPAQNISILRRALGDEADQPRYISTIARHGYRFLPIPIPLMESAAGPPEAGTLDRRWRRTVAGFIAGVLVTAIAVLIIVQWRIPPSDPVPLRFEERLAAAAASGDAAISPDGHQLAYGAVDDAGILQLWVRQLTSSQARAVPGTEGGSYPFWSPDGAFLGFRSGLLEIKRVDLASGTVRVIAPLAVVGPLGASWGPENVILYPHRGKIYSVSALGGAPRVAMDVEAAQLGEARWPVALPDGRHFTFYASGSSPDRTGTYLGLLGSPRPTLLVRGVRATYAPPDYLLYVRDRALMAQRFDLANGEIVGPAQTVPGEFAPAARISASEQGTLAITEDTSHVRLAWLDRRGSGLGTISFPGSPRALWLSPDDRYALTISDAGEARELWLIDTRRNVSTRIRDNVTALAWAPDGARFVFSALGGVGSDFYLRTVSGSQSEVLWHKANDVGIVDSWSSDGRFVVFTRFANNEQTDRDLWLVPTSGPRTPVPFAENKASETAGQISPGGHWIAYESNETGTSEVYIQPFPNPGPKVRISMEGGRQPIWRRDGRELFYLSADNQLMAVSIGTGVDPQPDPPVRLFQIEGAGPRGSFAVTADGQRFLTISRKSEARISILTNWEATLRP